MKNSDKGHNREVKDPLPQRIKGRSLLSELIESQNKAKLEQDHKTSDKLQTLNQDLADVHSSTNACIENDSIGTKVNYDRTTKVTRKEYKDHGAHNMVIKHSVEITEACTPSTDISNELNGVSKSSLAMPQMKASPASSPDKKPQDVPEQPVGLLSALLEESESKKYKPVSIRGECLTNPSEISEVGGHDNVEGNLVVHVNDIIKIINRNITTVTPSEEILFGDASNPLGMISFQVISLLGQGTFAQVFKCKDVETGKTFAIKIVKNKPAFTMQAKMEIEIFRILRNKAEKNILSDEAGQVDGHENDHLVSLMCHFMFKEHLCLVFELLGSNLYELLKKRQFRGLPLKTVQNLIRQAILGFNELSKRNIVHCDLKPENILLVSDDATHLENETYNKTVEQESSRIKLIDFGSACIEGKSTFSYIQSRFYRSPEVMIGINYDSAIDMWSLGCVAAELFLGLPILPGFHEHDQLVRLVEMIGMLPEWMLDQGKKTQKFFNSNSSNDGSRCWKIKTREEYARSLSKQEIEKYGGMSKIEAPPANRYFDHKLLRDIVLNCGKRRKHDDRVDLILFIHFLKGLLNPDPCERWTAYQASTHPFVNGINPKRTRSSDPLLETEDDINWSPPWDPAVATRKLSLKRPRVLHHQRAQSSSATSNLDAMLKTHNSSSTPNMTNKADNLAISYREREQWYQQPQPHNNVLYMSLPTHHAAFGQIPLQVRYEDSIQPPENLSVQTNLNYNNMTSNVSFMNSIESQPRLSMVGPQSFSGIYQSMGQVATQGDFGYALQRPGVVPTGAQTLYAQNQQSGSYGLIHHIHNQTQNYPDIHFSSGSYSNLQSHMTMNPSNTSLSMPPNFQGPVPQAYGTPQQHNDHHLQQHIVYQQMIHASQSYQEDESQKMYLTQNRSNRATYYSQYRGSSM